VEQTYAPSFQPSRWRTATIVASALAALELIALVAIGVAVAGKSVAHQVRAAALEQVSAPLPHVERATPIGAPRLTRAETDVLVLNGGGVAGAASAQADRLRALGYLIGSVGNTAHPGSFTRTLVMYRGSYRAEAARLAKDVRAKIVSPLDGMKPDELMGAQLVLVVGS
jgi:LytR cell envelope-related transcriptional attenuator